MNEFINKLISRLEVLKQVRLDMHDWQGQSAVSDAIDIVNQLAEETVSKMEKVDWIPCSSGKLPQMGEFDIKKIWVTMHRKGVDFYFTRKVNWNNFYKRWEWLNGKEMADEWEVVAWMYVEVPAPYQPKNCNNCANNTDVDEVDNGCYMCCKGIEDNYQPKGHE